MRALSFSFVVASILVSQAFATEQHSTDPEQAKREVAAGIEWVAANCNADDVPAFPVMMAMMIINGSSLEQMQAARDVTHRYFQQRFSSVADACTATIARLKAQ